MRVRILLDKRACRRGPLEARRKAFELFAGQLMLEYTIRTGIEVPQFFEPEVVEEFAEENPEFGKVFDKIMEVREAYLGF